MELLIFIPITKKLKQIHFNLDKCNAFLGTDLEVSDFLGIFEKLFIKTEIQSETILCTIPSFRNDLDREVDLFEEIARVFGYNNIPSSLNYYGSYAAFTNDERYFDDKLRQFVSSNGFHEHYSNSLNNIQDCEFSQNYYQLLFQI